MTRLQTTVRPTWAPGLVPRGPSCVSLPAADIDFAARLAGLGRQPIVLWAWLFAASSLAWPYLGLLHDSRLYAGQVLSRIEPDVLSRDLFFEYGSQDRFSLFSTLLAPLVRAVGFDIAFFAFYVVSLGAFLAALQRLVVRLVPDSAGAIVGLLFAAMAPLTYGGHNVFHVIEPFTTPRLLASALTLFGLSLTVEGRPIRATAMFLLGLAFHPLMTFPGVVVAIGYAIWRMFGGKVLGILISLTTLAVGVVFAIEPLGLRLFGHYDDAWKDGVRLFCPYQFPDTWRLSDWLSPALALGVGAIATWQLRHRPDAARFVALVTAVGFVGLVGAAIVVRLPYALPIMGQPYRAMWLITTLAPPLLFAMLERLWRMPSPWRSAALLPLFLLAPIDRLPLVVAAATSVLLVRFSGVAAGRRLGTILAGTAIGGIVLTGIARIVAILPHLDTAFAMFDPMFFYELLDVLAGPGLLVAIVLLAMRFTGRRLASIATAAALVGVSFAWQFAIFCLPYARATETVVDPYRPGIDFVAQILGEHRTERAPQVYSNLRRVEFIWLDWRAASYSDVNQTAGFLFTREATMEGLRRAPLVGPFEVDCLRRRRIVLVEEAILGAQAIGHFDASKPLEPQHLVRLASDSRLDWIVLWDLDSPELLAMATAIGPRVAVFDAKALRDR